MNVESQPAIEPVVLKFEGRCTVERVHELKSILSESLGRDGVVIVDIEALTEVDLSCLQILCAAHRAFLRRSKKLQIGPERPLIFDRAVRTAGFARTLGCHKDPDKPCLWKGVWKE